MHDQEIGVAAGLVRLSFLVQSIYAEVCEAQDLTPTQAQLLCVLTDGSRGMAELAQTLHLGKSSLSGLVDRAESKGLVRRVASRDDGRALSVELTKSGTKLATAFHDETAARLEQTVSCMPSDARAALTAIAGRLVREHEVPVVFQD